MTLPYKRPASRAKTLTEMQLTELQNTLAKFGTPNTRLTARVDYYTRGEDSLAVVVSGWRTILRT